MLLAAAITIRIGTEIVTEPVNGESKSAVVKSGAQLNAERGIFGYIDTTAIPIVRLTLIRIANDKQLAFVTNAPRHEARFVTGAKIAAGSVETLHARFDALALTPASRVQHIRVKRQ